MNQRVNGFWRWVLIISTVVGIVFSVNKLFYLNLFGITLIENAFLFYVLACFMPLAFIIFPATQKDREKGKVPFYDAILYVVAVGISIFFGTNGHRIILEGWEWIAPTSVTVSGIILWAIILEVLRRAGGNVIALICLLFSLYPLIASLIPLKILQGQSYDFITLANNHIMSANGVMGIAFASVGNLLIGFLFFGVVISMTGGGDFFFNLAQSIFGRTRGGTAKVAIVGSAFFGMLSGSAVSNAVTVGAMTIPAMKKTGFKAHYAAAVEAVASTGGSITPPIMGTAAFIMASFLGLPYWQIALAAVVPAILYYVGLFLQIDGYAAKHGLKGMDPEEIPSFWKTVKEGWYYIFALLVLVGLLGVLNSEAQAPYIASVVLIIIAFVKKQNRWKLADIGKMFEESGRVFAEIIAIIAGVGFIVGSLSATGVSFSFSRELVSAAGDNMLLILIGGALTCFVLGMGMTVSAVYVFLAVVMAPALVQIGVDPIAAHLFVIYWATVSYITPPVALAAFATASIAEANPMKTGFQAIQLGVVKFIVPFYMVYKPEILLGRGEVGETIIALVMVFVGVFFLAAGLEGYLLGAGVIPLWIRSVLIIAGGTMFFPGFIIQIISVVVVVAMFIYVRNNSTNKQDNEPDVQLS